jgi:hypothetical protein
MDNITRLYDIMKYEDLSYNEKGKAKFKNISMNFLRDLAKELELIEPRVSFNPGGIAVSGDATLMGMWTEDKGIYVHISQGPVAPIMYRTIKHMRDYTGGHNNWITFYSMDTMINIKQTMLRLRG